MPPLRPDSPDSSPSGTGTGIIAPPNSPVTRPQDANLSISITEVTIFIDDIDIEFVRPKNNRRHVSGLIPPPNTRQSSPAPPADSASELSVVKFEEQSDLEAQVTTNELSTEIVPFSYDLPAKRQFRLLRHARHTIGSVYRRLFSVIFLANIIALITIMATSTWPAGPDLSMIASAASANIFLAIFVRQEYFINSLFKICWIVPTSAPLRLRRILAKVYEFGGVHSSCAVSSVAWFILFTILLTNAAIKDGWKDPATLAITYLLLTLLVTIVVFAYPMFRTRCHNKFEVIHRFGGWSALLLFWVELVLFARLTTVSSPGNDRATTLQIFLTLCHMPSFWFLFVTSIQTIAPWFTLRKIYTRPERLSNHAIRMHFRERIPPFTGIRISTSPLIEWHAFAGLSSSNGFSLIISNAGDWTNEAIKNPREYYWTKGIPVTGVLNMAQIFRKVVIVTTGSGIGPCLSFLVNAKNKHCCRIIWSASSPQATFGNEICNMVKEIDPKAMIIDTKKEARPNLVALAYQLYKESDAEAVFIISNPKLTKKVVYGMESRGVPGFGPVWDS